MAAKTPNAISEIPIGNARIIRARFDQGGSTLSNLDTWNSGITPILDVFGQMTNIGPDVGGAVKLNIVVSGSTLTFYTADDVPDAYTIYVYTVN